MTSTLFASTGEVNPYATGASPALYSATGGYGSVSPMVCPNCTSIPQGVYPTGGMVGGYGGIGGMMAPGVAGFMGTPDKSKDGKDNQNESVLGKAGSLLPKLIDNIPDAGLKKGLQEYVRIVNPKAYGGDIVGGSNSGVASYFSANFSSNQCFQDAAVQFYRDIAMTLSKKYKCDTSNKNIPVEFSELPYGCSTRRPSLDDQAEQEGWILRLAMKYSKGNPEAALQLIGMCGHDDVAQGIYNYFDKSETAKERNLQAVASYKEQKKDIDGKLKESFKNFDKDQQTVYQLSSQSSYLAQVIDYQSKMEGQAVQLQCPPQSSDFFLPGSLSNEADISPALKSKIKSIQGNGKASNYFLPAKYYHVYGSAFLGCKMVQNGMSESQAVTVQKQAARLYRGLRMCESARGSIKDREMLGKVFHIKNIDDSKELESDLMQLWQQKNNGDFSCLGKKKPLTKKKKDFSSEPSWKSNEKCYLLQAFDLLDLEPSEVEVVKKKINGRLARADVGLLYNSWYFGGGSIAGQNLPCTDIRMKGPSDLMKPNEGIVGKVFKPTGWSNERFEAASKRLATWDVDFEWTIAQHEAGSKFGAKICSESKDKKNPFDGPNCKVQGATGMPLPPGLGPKPATEQSSRGAK